MGPLIGLGTGPTTASVLTFFHSTLPDSRLRTTHCGSAQYSSRYSVTRQTRCIIFMPSPGSTQAGHSAKTVAGHVGAQSARLDRFQLEESVSFYLERALAPSTRRSYTSGQRSYMAICEAAKLQPLPLVEQNLCMFVAQLAKEGLAHQTIMAYLSVLRNLVILAGHSDLFMGDTFPLLQYVLRGIKRTPSQSPRQPRMPITPAILLWLKR